MLACQGWRAARLGRRNAQAAHMLVPCATTGHPGHETQPPQSAFERRGPERGGSSGRMVLDPGPPLGRCISASSAALLPPSGASAVTASPASLSCPAVISLPGSSQNLRCCPTVTPAGWPPGLSELLSTQQYNTESPRIKVGRPLPVWTLHQTLIKYKLV